MAYATVTLTGTYHEFDGTPAKGHVRIFPSVKVVKDTTGNVILTNRHLEIQLDAQGAFSVDLPATDDPTLNPNNFGYTIAARLDHHHPKPVSFDLPADLVATTVEDLTPVDPSTFAPTTTYAEKSELDAVAATVPTNAADLGAEPAGLAQGTTDTLNATHGRSQRGLYIPGGWGDQWKAAKAAAEAGTGTATVAVMGDSVSDGFHFPSTYNKSWWGLLRTDLHARRDGGSGFVGVERSALFQTGVPNFATQYASSSADIPVASGTWIVGGSPDGAGSVQVYSNEVGATFTFPVRGTDVTVVYNQFGSPGLGGPFSVTIDGNVAGTLTSDGNGTPAIKKHTYTVADGTHNVVITVTGPGYAALNGVKGSRATGFICDNYARAGAATISYAGDASSDPAFAPAPWSGGPQMPADLFIFALGVNDANGVIPPTDYRTRIRMIIDQVRVQTPADVLILANHVGNWQSLPGYYTDYVATMREMCDVYGAALVNVWADGHNRWDDWNTQGFWGDANNVGATGTDGVHPSDLGHAHIHSLVAPVVLAD